MRAQRWQEPNLARAPFVNERPVRRLALGLWILFVVVGAIAFWLSLSLRQETGARLAELVRLNTETTAARERATALDRELRSANLPAQNERTNFLNSRLAERSFSWGRLLETLSRSMPRGVRLLRLSPEGFVRQRTRGASAAVTAATTRVALRISGEAEETEALLEFVDRLYRHPAFDRPNLSRESEKKDTRIQFELTVGYLPEMVGADGTPATATAAGSPAVVLGAAGSPGSSPGSAAAGGARGGGAFPPGTTVPNPPVAPSGATQSAGAAKSEKSPGPFDGRTAGAGRAAERGSAWGDGGKLEPGDTADESADARTAGARSGERTLTGGAALLPGGSPGQGSGAPGAPSGGPTFPANVMPTPLQPYASSMGGIR